MTKNFIILLFLLLSVWSSNAQSRRLITVHGQLIDMSNGKAVPYANLVNLRIHGGTTSDANGRFTLPIQVRDSIIITVLGYDRTVFKMGKSFALDTTVVIEMKPTSYSLKEVSVTNQKSIDFGFQSNITKTPIPLRSDDFSKKPPLLAALLNPVGFAHYYLSRTEKNKRNALSISQQLSNWDKLRIVYNDSTIMKLTGIKAANLDSFKIFCNPYFSPDTIYPQSEIYRRVLIAYKKYVDSHK
ncbi:MAG: carboxypeptidase-like regulatory domain-containing protein [Bacteroidota bacterium]|nr:carboxypeptidase-like regulatory domain-containing protein [Bacteroidota bacterium]MDP4205309.1 carboxypeptidase-like regulatory domain-containing protein [Bacteroidota bacterium]